jgi:hypothetical protein
MAACNCGGGVGGRLLCVALPVGIEALPFGAQGDDGLAEMRDFAGGFGDRMLHGALFFRLRRFEGLTHGGDCAAELSYFERRFQTDDVD